MPLEQENGLRLLQVGQAIGLYTHSPIYRGNYQSQVIGIEDAGVRITLPIEDGKLTLLPVGLSVVVTVNTAQGVREYPSRVLERRAGTDRYLLLEAPAVKKQAPMERLVPVWAVTSGKGGVGKTTVICNLAIALAELGKRVCVIDGDLGTANIDIMLNLPPKYNLSDVVSGNRHILEAVIEGPKGIIVLPGSSGLQEITELKDDDFERLLRQFQILERYTDIMLIDTSSGLSRSVTNFIVAANQAVLVTAPDPPAITDAYALVKVLARAGYQVPMKVVVNKVRSPQEAIDVADKMVFAAKHFLQYEISAIGHVTDDELVERSVREQVAVVERYPKTMAAQDLHNLAATLLGLEVGPTQKEQQVSPLGFLQRLRALIGFRGGGSEKKR
jgi:flagellar biosynthesis protein FlhG